MCNHTIVLLYVLIALDLSLFYLCMEKKKRMLEVMNGFAIRKVGRRIYRFGSIADFLMNGYVVAWRLGL